MRTSASKFLLLVDFMESYTVKRSSYNCAGRNALQATTPMDPLVEISGSDLSKLRNIYRTSNWPYGIEGYSILNTQLLCPTLTEAYDFKFYSLGSDITLGMVTVNNKEHYYEVYICPTSASGLFDIENALANTSVIDWTKKVTVASANSDVLACLRRLKNKIGFQITLENKVCKHLLDKDTKPYENLNLPENTYVGPIIPEYLNLVNRTWTFYSEQHSFENFQILMKLTRTYALYSSEDHKPLAWIFVDNAGAFTHLYCLGTHRRKGYAEYITKVATNDLLSQGKDVLAYTLEENFKPQNLFNKLGFDFIDYVWWVFLTKEK